MKIVLLSAPEIEDKGKYSQLLVKYSSDGKDQERKIMSFTFKDVYETLKSAQVGEAFEVKLVKDGKYWNWAEVKPTTVDVQVGMKASGSKSTSWETADERAAKQIYIVRQSSIASAVNYFNANVKELKSAQDVIEVAKQFEAYVFGNASNNEAEPAEVE